MDHPKPAAPQKNAVEGFPVTRWSLILAAGEQNNVSHRNALAELCQSYWYPLYAFARRQGKPHEDAQDLTQAFLLRLLERDDLNSAEREKGRFRTFLLAAFKRLLIDDWRKTRTQRRGGDIEFVELDTSWGQQRFDREPESPLSAETLYDRGWALTVLDCVNSRLQQAYATAEKQNLFTQIRPLLLGNANESYAEVGDRLGLSEGAVTMAVRRMRTKFGELIREEVSHTVADPDDVNDEVRWLMTVLAQETS